VRLATARQEARLIAVDGLPLAGKSTLAGKLAAALQAGGAYSYPTVGTTAALAALRAAATGPVLPAGEALHAEGETGTVEAALASGKDAAAKIISGG
jgi:cytidylate kinase